jgi:hypothetical protein
MDKLKGKWFNELGSIMDLQVNNGAISGTYQTKVGDAHGIYELVGQVDTDNDESTAIGWVIVWNNKYGSSDSVTAWSGQFQCIDSKDTIITTWLLTGETIPTNDWRSTFIGKDIFTRNPPTETEIVKNYNRGVKNSFPKK